MAALLLTLLPLALLLAGHADAFDLFGPYPGISCPSGFDIIPQRTGGGLYCRGDPCVGNPCGAGNTCTTQGAYTGGPFAVYNCTQCNPPYVSLTAGVTNLYSQIYCYIPGQDPCNPNPCQNGGKCSYVLDPSGSNKVLTGDQNTPVAAACDCGPAPQAFTGTFCSIPLSPPGMFPPTIATVDGITGPQAGSDFSGVCANANGCIYKDSAHYLCCQGLCGPYGPDGNTPLCTGQIVIPANNAYPPTQPAFPPLPPPTTDQGVCGSGPAAGFPNRCYFNNDPQGRYVCCGARGCFGFASDNQFPRCVGDGYVPPNYGLSGPTPPTAPTLSPPTTPTPPSPPTGDQGVCGSGAANDFPTRCYFNSDPQGRYVCCDKDGCNGFNADNLFPHCKSNGYVPPGYGVGASPTTPTVPSPASGPSGDQGVCGSGAANDFPTRCWFNSDPQGRYVCCDRDGCDGFLAPDNLFPHCKSNGFVPPGYGK